MSSYKKIYLIYLDILGFGPLAESIASEKAMEVREVRKKLKTTIEIKIQDLNKDGILMSIISGRDDWILAVDTKQKLFSAISKILDHYTGYHDYKTVPLEIAIGVENYDKWAYQNANELLFENQTIEYLKSNMTIQYREWYKNKYSNPIKETFIVFTSNFIEELQIYDRNLCREIPGEKSNFFFLPLEIIERDKKILDFLNEIRQIKSDFSGALIDRVFIPPDGFDEIKDILSTDRIVFITGTAGYGKTYTTIRLLWEYYNRGYKPCWISGQEEAERRNVRARLANIETQLDPGRIIYFEDPFGKTTYERRDDLKERINYITNTIKNKENVYVIITSRKDVFEDFEKETYSVEEIRRFERELNILQPAYDTEKRKKILETWALEKNCEWFKIAELKEFIIKSIANKEILPTPLSIYDFVEATLKTTNKKELELNLSDYSKNSERSFADEIIGLYESKHNDRVLFLSLIFISEFLEVNLIKEEYDKFKEENYVDFKEILKEEYRVKERSFKDQIYLEFSHPSYSQSIKFILRHSGCKRIFWKVTNDLLNSEHSYIRMYTVMALGKIGDPQAVIPLLKTLEDPNWSVRTESAKALGEIGDEKALEHLIQASNDKDWSVRRAAVKGLGEIGKTDINTIIKSLKDSDFGVRRAAAIALGKIGDPQAVQPLIEALEDMDWTVRLRSAEALGKIGDPQAVKPLIETLKEGYYLGHMSLNALEKIGKPVIKPLIENFRFLSYGLEDDAIKTLGKIGKAEIKPLIELLSSPNWHVRAIVAKSLGKTGNADTIQFLGQLLEDNNHDVQIAAIRSLGEIGGSRITGMLLKSLNDQNSIVRMNAAIVLAEVGGPQEVKSLIQLVKNQGENKYQVIHALIQIGKPAVKDLFELLRCQESNILIDALNILKEICDSAEPEIIKLLENEDERIKYKAIEVLGEIGDPQTIEILRETLPDLDEDIEIEVVVAMEMYKEGFTN